jgi:O-methyltransferase
MVTPVWKRSVNASLRRLTGYQVLKGAAADELARQHRASRRQAARWKARAERSERKLARTSTRLEQAQERLEQARDKSQREARSRGKEIPGHYDRAAAEILRRVEPRTMTDMAKLFGLVEATRYVARRGIPGDIVECGVWRGGSMQAVALALMEQGAADRRLHLFDTFEGMPPPTEKDRREHVTAEELLAQHDKDHRVWAVAALEDVQEAMQETGYPQDLVHYCKGLVEDTIPARAPERISLLRLDTDWYESTRHELVHLYERLSPGGVLIIDDYGDWQGARLATEEFLATVPEVPLLLPIGTGRLAIKPGR